MDVGRIKKKTLACLPLQKQLYYLLSEKGPILKTLENIIWVLNMQNADQLR